MSIECLACPTLGPSAPLSDTPRGNLRWAHYPHFPIAVLVPSFEHGRKCTSGALSAPGAVLVLPFEPPASRRVPVLHAGLLRFPVRGSYRNVGPPRATCTRRPRAGVSLGRFRASSGLPFVGLDVSAPPAACGRRGSCFCCCSVSCGAKCSAGSVAGAARPDVVCVAASGTCECANVCERGWRGGVLAIHVCCGPGCEVASSLYTG